MLSKKQISLIQSLRQKKFRQQTGLFIVEGKKTISEFYESSYQLHRLYTTTFDLGLMDDKCTRITPKELKKISFLSTPQEALALFKMPQSDNIFDDGLTVALDRINDPGNLGTIIRLCDWFGINSLVCSEGTVDCYNPKTVQSSMGSLSRVDVIYCDLTEYLQSTKRHIYGTFMDGKSVYDQKLQSDAILLMGNEANGIDDQLRSFISEEIGIPRFGAQQKTESLNVAMATAIFLSEFRR